MQSSNILFIQQFHNEIIQNKKVSLFVHEYPDFDALASAAGLRAYLLALNIECKIIGSDLVDSDLLKKFWQTYQIDNYDDQFIQDSIGIILDTANVERVHTQKQHLVKSLYRIDHHPKIQTIGQLEWVDDQFSSTSEMVGWLIFYNNPNLFNQTICNYLYTGILADSGKFMYSLTNQSTFELVAKFYDYGFDKNLIQDLMFLKSWNSYKKDLKISKYTKVINNDIAYLLLDKVKLWRLKLKNNVTKIHLLNDFKDFKIWFSLIYNKSENNWKGSIRSRNYNVNLIAKQFNGGGHVLASGFKLANKNEVKQFIKWISLINLEDYFIK